MDVIEKITELGFDLNSYSNGKHECTCPFCSAHRKPIHQKQRCAAVWIEEDFATYNCVHCGEHGFLFSDKPSQPGRYELPKVQIPDTDNLKLAVSFFETRGIRLETARKLGVYVETKGKQPLLAFPFYKGGRIVNVKYRGINEKHFYQGKNPEPVVYNYDKVFGQKEVVIVEGEMDVLAFAEVGVENVVSVPSGSIGQPVDSNYKGAKFDFLKVSQPLFDIADRVVLALDNDGPGQYMTQALIDRIGKDKCWLVDWGQYKVKGKDANDFLLADRSILQDAIATAKPVPLRGIVNAGDDMESFESYVEQGTSNAISTGFPDLDDLILFEYGNFVTITGYPGCLSWSTKIRINREHHGKTVTIKDLYQRFNGLDPRYKWKDSPTYIRRYVNGKIVLSKVEAVTYSGVKPTMELTLDDGKVLRATPDHRILTTNGYKQLQALTTDDFVVVDNVDKKTAGGRTTFKRYKERTVGSLHPYAKYHAIRDKDGKVYDSWRVPEHRLIYDAAQNGISVRELIVRTHKDVSGLTFVDPKELVIHHKDGNPTNNIPDNLEAITEREHLVGKHSCANNLKQGIPDVAKVVSVRIAGIGPTYDIQCETIPDNEPNFNANGIMVHNSGKSLFATDLIMNLAEIHNMKTLYCAFENTPNQLKKKWLQMRVGEPVMGANPELIEKMRQHYKFIADHFYILQDYTRNPTVDEILDMAQGAIRRYNIGCVIVDPFNKLMYSRTSNFTEDVAELLTKMIAFAKRNNVLMFLVAHPTKPAERKLGAQSTPSGFDISGSANFLNMSDIILTVHRKQDEFGNKSNTARVMVSKVRDTDFGHEGSCYFSYDPVAGRYRHSSREAFESEEVDPTKIILKGVPNGI